MMDSGLADFVAGSHRVQQVLDRKQEAIAGGITAI
jgi:hypothetical protein